MNLEPIDTSTTAGKVELKPCPFCGGDAAIRKWQDEELWSHTIVEWQKVHCTECECEGISSCPGYEPDTVQVWNTRAPQWQPIESAPRDGSTILVYGKAYRTPGKPSQPYPARWSRGWWMEGASVVIEYVTHWQPLPAPPEVQP